MAWNDGMYSGAAYGADQQRLGLYQGRQQGLEEGYNNGYADGYADGQNDQLAYLDQRIAEGSFIINDLHAKLTRERELTALLKNQLAQQVKDIQNKIEKMRAAPPPPPQKVVERVVEDSPKTVAELAQYRAFVEILLDTYKKYIACGFNQNHGSKLEIQLSNALNRADIDKNKDFPPAMVEFLTLLSQQPERYKAYVRRKEEEEKNRYFDTTELHV